MPADEAIILAGGRGTRLRTVISDVPKPLAPVAGRPFLAWVLDHLAAVGMRRCILATGYMAEAVEKQVGRRWRDMDIAYSVEETALGTGGAVGKATDLLWGKSVHVLNGDTFLRYKPADLELATRVKDADIGLALAHVDDVSRYGAVYVERGRVLAFHEKGGHGSGLINAGSYYFTSPVLEDLRSRSGPLSLENDVLLPRAVAGDIAAFCDTSDFIDIGIPDDYARAQKIFASIQ